MMWNDVYQINLERERGKLERKFVDIGVEYEII